MEMEESNNKLETDYEESNNHLETDYEELLDMKSYESFTVNQDPKRLRISEAHEYFDDVTNREIEGFITLRSCQFCGLIIKCGFHEPNIDSILHRHLEICTERIRGGEIREKSFCDETPPVWKFDHAGARRAVVRYFISIEVPLNTKEIRLDFPKELCNPVFKPPTGSEVRSEIRQMYKEEKQVLMEYFKSYTGKIALSYKFWRSCYTEDSGYYAVTAHYIDSDWNLQKRLLGFKKLRDPDDVKDRFTRVAVHIRIWDIASKVFSITSDNNDDSTDDIIAWHRKIMPAMGGEDTFFHVRCCARVLNLIAQDGLQEIDSFIKHIYRILTDMVCDKSRYEEFLEVFKALDVEYKRIPFNPSEDRWDGFYLALDAVISYRTVVDRYISGKEEFSPFSDDDWFLATLVRDFLKVFHDAVTYLARNYYATSCQVLCHILDIGLVIEKYPTNPVISRLCQEANRKLRSFWEEIPIICGLSSIMDPRLKFRGLEILIKSIYKSGIYDVDCGASDYRLTEIKSALDELFEKYQSQSCSGNVDRSKEVGSSSSQTQTKAWEILLEHFNQSSCDRKSELQLYLDLPNVAGCSEGNGFDILGWWKAQETNFPVLATMARDLLTVPMTAVFSLLAFQTSPFFVDNDRTILSQTMVNCSRCIRDWSKVGQRIQDVPIDEVPIEEDDEEDAEEMDVGKP